MVWHRINKATVGSYCHQTNSTASNSDRNQTWLSIEATVDFIVDKETHVFFWDREVSILNHGWRSRSMSAEEVGSKWQSGGWWVLLGWQAGYVCGMNTYMCTLLPLNFLLSLFLWAAGLQAHWDNWLVQFQCPLIIHKNRTDRRAEWMGHHKASIYLHSHEAHGLLTAHASVTRNLRFYTDDSL